jgi:hypothetical protein
MEEAAELGNYLPLSYTYLAIPYLDEEVKGEDH